MQEREEAGIRTLCHWYGMKGQQVGGPHFPGKISGLSAACQAEIQSVKGFATYRWQDTLPAEFLHVKQMITQKQDSCEGKKMATLTGQSYAQQRLI